MRLLAALVAFPLITTFAPLSLFRDAPLPARTRIAFDPVPLDAENPARRRVGRLVYLGGWSIRSNDPRFGGISAMHVEDGRVLALSDSGSLIEFGLPGRPGPVSIRPLPEGPGDPGKLDRDAETLAVSGDQAWIAFEGRNAIWRYSLPSWRAESDAEPAPMRRWPGNTGSEALLRFPDGGFAVFAEHWLRPNGSSDVVAFAGDAAVPGTPTKTLGYRPPKNYRVTDAALLPDGRILFLNRRFSWLHGISAKLTVAAPTLAAGSVIEGEEIAHFDAPVTVDNMEALSVTREAGRTIVWMASDDNFTALQRTLLLKFELTE
jgi:hypothetical protein